MNLANRIRVFQNRVIAGAIRKTHAVNVPFDESGHNRSAFQIDDASARHARGSGITHCHESTISDRDISDDCVARIHRVNAAIRENQILIRSGRRGGRLPECYLDWTNAGSGRSACRCAQKIAPGHALFVSIFHDYPS
jgi:hypothetical protein